MSDKQHGVYPADEFDNPSQGPVGLHRGPRSLASRALPYVIVLLVAAALAFGVFAWLSHANSGSSSEASQSTSTSVSSAASSKSSKSASAKTSTKSATKAATTASQTPTATETATPTATPSTTTPTPTATVNKSTSVTVYNGTRRSGLAASSATTLRNAGYASVSARNPSNRNTLPSTSTVWYSSADDEATARDIASQLGISQVARVDGLGTGVAVVLMQ
ncbi:LytR family transcriptional regulator [Bifidobacterium sp. SMB2]|uniref:LytR family transcriptional regulator n=1 Tax=Bifidobacterium saimiriisciurei TaxID=2661627 RepID=A0ABX0C9W7_9BIFI|nr:MULTISPECIES: LytR C-terminal domain-containing protein [Bifidobacterium]NEG95611.1 LytR family transcriptional regulator [Bifidobacterium sp. SMB2]NEH11924.1 LytR family transcriptional regulator [Bifidobacterium saimiriisciurei]